MSHGHDDFAFEPIRGLPERLPDGERILWQGAPHWRELAVRAFHIRAVLVYFGALMLWRGFSVIDRGQDLGMALQAALALVPLAALATGLLSLAAWMAARATVYTITNRRVVMRVGIALTKTINIPFKVIDGAAVGHGSGQHGDLALVLAPKNRIAFLQLWPHVRPWHIKQPQPALRSVRDVETVASVLRKAVQAWQAENGIAIAATAAVDLPVQSAGEVRVPGSLGLAH